MKWTDQHQLEMLAKYHQCFYDFIQFVLLVTWVALLIGYFILSQFSQASKELPSEVLHHIIKFLFVESEQHFQMLFFRNVSAIVDPPGRGEGNEGANTIFCQIFQTKNIACSIRQRSGCDAYLLCFPVLMSVCNGHQIRICLVLSCGPSLFSVWPPDVRRANDTFCPIWRMYTCTLSLYSEVIQEVLLRNRRRT